MPITFKPENELYMWSQDDCTLTFKAIPRAFVYSAYNEAEDIRTSFQESIKLICETLVNSDGASIEIDGEETPLHECTEEKQADFFTWLYDENESFRNFAEALIQNDKKKLSETS